MEKIVGYKDLSLEEMGRVIKGYVNHYKADDGYHLRFSDVFYALIDDAFDRIKEWHVNTILNDSDRIGVHKLRMKVGLGNGGIKQIPYKETDCTGYDHLFDIEVVYCGEYRDCTYDVQERIWDVFKVNMEVIV